MTNQSDATPSFNHFDPEGRVHMVDVSAKAPSLREAVAEAIVDLQTETRQRIEANAFSKGDVLATAELAGVMGAKQTSHLIPLCHPLPLTHVSVKTRWIGESLDGRAQLSIEATVRTFGVTGVEMEALTACTTAALTVYDMCKSADKSITIQQIQLQKKTGGKSGPWTRHAAQTP